MSQFLVEKSGNLFLFLANLPSCPLAVSFLKIFLEMFINSKDYLCAMFTSHPSDFLGFIIAVSFKDTPPKISNDFFQQYKTYSYERRGAKMHTIAVGFQSIHLNEDRTY